MYVGGLITLHCNPAWYDLGHESMNFTQQVPVEAMPWPLLSNAILGFAALHLSTTTMPSLGSTADMYAMVLRGGFCRVCDIDFIMQVPRALHLAASPVELRRRPLG